MRKVYRNSFKTLPQCILLSSIFLSVNSWFCFAKDNIMYIASKEWLVYTMEIVKLSVFNVWVIIWWHNCFQWTFYTMKVWRRKTVTLRKKKKNPSNRKLAQLHLLLARKNLIISSFPKLIHVSVIKAIIKVWTKKKIKLYTSNSKKIEMCALGWLFYLSLP